MYFKSRVEAGKLLAEQLSKKYTGDNTTAVALSDGGVMIGAQIALKLHCALTMLLSDAIKLPREETAIGGISQDGTFTYNTAYSPGQIEELVQEYRNLIEQEKIDKINEMHRLMGHGGLIKKSMLRGHNVILVSDGLSNGFSLDLATEFLKPINIKRLIVAVPLASVPAVDRMHILADEICCLSVVEDYMTTDHYYDTQDVPSHEQVIKTIEQIVSHWK